MINKTHNASHLKRSILSFIVLSVFLFLAVGSIDTEKAKPGKKKVSRVETTFAIANEGDYWKIMDDNISVSKVPKTPANKAAFLRNLVTIIGPGTKVEILESKGIISPWKRVYVYNDRNQIYAEGWILAETVKNAKRIQKGTFSP